MMSLAQLAESAALKNLQELSEARGMKFYLNPARDIVPEFLGNFQPDAIALGPEGGIIIEVKTRRNAASDKQLSAIARKVSSQKGWEFRAIYLNLPAEQTLPIAEPSFEQLEAKFQEIEALTKGGHPAAALVTAWAALESLARLAAARRDAPTSRAFSPLQAIQTLAEEGFIENEDAEHLRAMVVLRNAAVHGDFSVDIPTEQVEALLEQLRAIETSMKAVVSEGGA